MDEKTIYSGREDEVYRLSLIYTNILYLLSILCMLVSVSAIWRRSLGIFIGRVRSVIGTSPSRVEEDYGSHMEGEGIRRLSTYNTTLLW